MSEPLFEGVLSAIITPFDSDGNVDFDALRDVVRFQIEGGVHGFFACGTVGEGVLMSIGQRKDVAEAIVREAKGRVPVIVHVGTTNTSESVELAKHAEQIGAKAVGAVAPFFFKPDVEGLRMHYQSIAEAVNIPVFVYNIPRMTGFNITAEIFRKLCIIEGVAGIKDSSGNLSQIQEIIETAPKPITVINGADDIFLAVLIAGASAEISGTANVAPELLVEIYESYKEGDLRKALKLQRKLNALKRVLYEIGSSNVSSIKAALEMRGVKAGVPKKPLRPLSSEELSRLKDKLSALNLYW
ncbi:4-hydroxy-tetrahydrodipicolinate synthase [Candidatus Bathyarchaeota archaeon]|nr:4-hydroxy-tetrahydrodipicolinate synthase [Candidatus Bathyarchaeota archaeon]